MKRPWSIASLIRKEEREWLESNDLRRRLRHSAFEREVLRGAEQPVRYAFSLTALLALAILLAYVLPQDWSIGYRNLWGAGEKLSYFTTLWSVQATIVALVYPFAIAFVSLLLQRRPSSNAFIQIYLFYSGGLVAGLSSMFLVLCMAIQYVMLSSYSLNHMVMWGTIDAVWFTYNAILTIWFVFRTVEFLRPDFQFEVVKRYAINVALPRDIANLLRFQLFAVTQDGWIHAPEDLGDVAERQPQVLMQSIGLEMAEVSVETWLQGQARLTNVFYWPLRIAVVGWLKEARKQPPAATSEFPDKPKPPLLVFPVVPGGTYEGKVVLARVAGGPDLSLWQRALLRMSFRFTPLRLERRYVTATEILHEIETDARVSAGNGNVAAFEDAFRNLTQMHVTLIGASLVNADDGGTGSWALMPDILRWDRPIHEEWRNAYRSLFEAAASLIPAESRPIRQLCHVVERLDGPALQRSPVEIRERILLIPTHLMYSLGIWWSHRIEEQGFLQHGQNEMALLRPPLQGVYEEALLCFVGGWESARQMLAEIPDNYDEFDWANAKNLLRLNIRHINQTCLMLLKAVARGDQAAAEWLSDVISKWWAAASTSDDEPFYLFGKTDFITIETVNREWSVVDKSLNLDENDKQLFGKDEKLVQKHVCFAALKNYWSDIRLLTVEIIVSWAAEEQSQVSDRSLAVYVASGLLTGRKWRGGGRTEESLSEMSASDYLTAKCRQFAADSNYRQGYIELLDKFVESAADILRPQMVSGRGYSLSGADDVRSLQEAQLILLIVLSRTEWELGESLRRQLAIWTSSNFRSTMLLKDRIEAMKQRLEEIGYSLRPTLIDQLISKTRNSLEPSDGIKRTQSALENLHSEITNLQTDAVVNAPISKQRLIEIEEGASKIGFSNTTGKFPLQLFLSVNYEAFPQEPFTLIFSNLRKGEFTEVEMAQRAINDLESFAKSVANHVGSLLLVDVIGKCETRDVFATDATAYGSALKAEAKILKDSGFTPILILDNPTRPEWMWEWKIGRKDGGHPRPADLLVRRETRGRGPGYIADFNDIQVYGGPIVPGHSLLVARETFSSVTFRAYREDVLVKATITEAELPKTLVNLQLTYERKVEVEHNKIIRIHYN